MSHAHEKVEKNIGLMAILVILALFTKQLEPKEKESETE